MRLRTFALTAAVAGSVGLAGCGGDEQGGANAKAADAGDAGTLLVNTFQPSRDGAKIKSGRIDIALSGELAGGAVQGSGKANATIKLDRTDPGRVPEFSASVDVDGKQQGGGKIDLTAGGTYVGDRVYVNYDGEDYDLGAELSKRAISSLRTAIAQTNSGQADESQDLVGKLGLQPQTWLTNPKIDGEEEIGGTDTYKITGQVNVKALVPDILDAARKAQSLTGGAGGAARVPTVSDAQLDAAAQQFKKLDVTIWTGKDDSILRKLQVDLQIATPQGQRVTGTASLTLTDVNEKQDIKAPSETKPLTDLLPKLGGLFPSAAGTGGNATSPGGVSQKYLDCMNEAGGDAAKLNRCQSLATR